MKPSEDDKTISDSSFGEEEELLSEEEEEEDREDGLNKEDETLEEVECASTEGSSGAEKEKSKEDSTDVVKSNHNKEKNKAGKNSSVWGSLIKRIETMKENEVNKMETQKIFHVEDNFDWNFPNQDDFNVDEPQEKQVSEEDSWNFSFEKLFGEFYDQVKNTVKSEIFFLVFQKIQKFRFSEKKQNKIWKMCQIEPGKMLEKKNLLLVAQKVRKFFLFFK
jgi:hypothetical protein